MKRKLSFLALVSALLLSAAPVQAEDGFYVVGGRYTPGTRITSLPYTINAPGYYYLTGNLSSSAGNGITVANGVNNVTIDLMGFVLTGPGNNTGAGIDGGGTNLEVRNGTITGWNMAIYGHASNQRAIGVRAVGNYSGILLLYSDSLIKDCTATQGSFAAGYRALSIGTGKIIGCTAYNFTLPTPGFGSVNIVAGTASDNVVINSSSHRYPRI